VDLTHEVSFTFELGLPWAEARAFVRDVPRSLSHADFLADLQVVESRPRIVTATLPVNAALFGQRELPFRSELSFVDTGAVLRGLPLEVDGPGWAEVSGEARVEPVGGASRAHYAFSITIHLDLPAPEKWGGRALLKMVEFTAGSVLRGVVAHFPEAVQTAARELEAAGA
jgi:hypothetical protein